MEAEISGHQRKVMSASVRPARSAYGTAGIAIRDGRALPFVVTRKWTAPAGHYREQWFLVRPDTNEILFEGPERLVLIWGLQSLTELRDDVEGDFPLVPGDYRLVFALDRVLGGEVEVGATEAPEEAA